MPNPYQPYQPPAGGNPYLAQMGQGITQQANQNLMNVTLPAINSGAQMAGGFGGSRQGVAQGTAIGMNQQGIAQSLASLYGKAYEGDQNRAAQWDIADMANTTNLTGINNQYQLGLGQNAIGMKNADTNLLNANNSYSLGTTKNANDLTLGLGQNAIGMKNADTNALNANNNYLLGSTKNANDLTLGLGANANDAAANANNLTLGTAKNANDALAIGNNFTLGTTKNANDLTLGLGANANDATANANNLTLGTAKNANDLTIGTGANANGLISANAAATNAAANATDVANKLTLGTAANANDAAKISNDYSLGTGNLLNQFNANATNAAAVGSNIFTSGLTNSITAADWLTNSGLAEMKAPGTVNQTYADLLKTFLPATGSGTSTTPDSGGGVAGAIGGGLTALQFINLLQGKPVDTPAPT